MGLKTIPGFKLPVNGLKAPGSGLGFGASFRNGALLNQFILNWWNNIKADGGEVQKISDVDSYYKMCVKNDMADSIKFGMLGGYNLRTDGNTKYVTKAYSLDSVPNDATQTTEANQPFQTGFIAPNEKWGVKNPSGDSRLLTHASLTTTGTITTVKQLYTTGKFEVVHEDVTSETNTDVTADGIIVARIIRNETLSTAQKAVEENWFKNNGYLGYEGSGIPAVKIGDQVWQTSNFEAVATPMGNVIQEMKAGSATDKIPQPLDFTQNVWTTINSDVTILSSNSFTTITNDRGVRNVTTVGFLYNTSHWYKITSIATGGDYKIFDRNGAVGTTILLQENDGVFYWKPNFNESQLYITIKSGVTIEFSTFNVEELGWADSQELYDGLIAQGKTEQVALKASAMWCYYNNDPSLGAIYGKLYNWYAVKLLQNDIDAYNLANPTTPWGWHVPSLAEFNTLATTLGGASVAGGKMKVAGTDYWSSPNNGATNESGFSSIMSGIRTSTFIKTRFYCWVIEIYRNIQNRYDSNQMLNGVDSSIFGMSIRLIKD